MIGNTRHFYWPFFLLDVIRGGKTQGSVTNFGRSVGIAKTEGLTIALRFFLTEQREISPKSLTSCQRIGTVRGFRMYPGRIERYYRYDRAEKSPGGSQDLAISARLEREYDRC